jgi:prolipoprotein diacylglyceryltransferase
MSVDAIPAQHPTQLYEALCYLVTFMLLAYLYYAKDLGRRRPGLLFGIGLQGIFLTRFCIEFIKLEQESFEKGMLLDMGQILSIPFVLLGAYIIYRALSNPAVEVEHSKEKVTPVVAPSEKKNKKRKVKW